MNTFRFAVGTIIGPIRVCVASGLIIAISAAEMESKVSSGFEILENSLAAVRWLVNGQDLYQQHPATANEISGRGACAVYINEPTIAW
jgi:hypothetical protein